MMTKETSPAAGGDAFATLLDTLSAATTTNADMVKAMSAESDYEIGEDGQPKLGDDGKPMRKKPMRKDDDGTEGDMMGKALSVQLSDGSTLEALDATDILKALDSDMGKLRAAVPSLVRVVQVQGNLLKAMQSELAELRQSGTGRRAVVNVAEKPAVSEPHGRRTEGLTPGEFMAKALEASTAGVLSSMDCARLDAAMARGMQPDPELRDRVLNHNKK